MVRNAQSSFGSGLPRSLLWLSLSLVAAAGAPATLLAADFYVDGSNGSDANTGRSWAAAKQTIQAAVDEAGLVPGSDTVHVAAATYWESVDITHELTLRGGYPAGGGIRDLARHETTIRGFTFLPCLFIAGAGEVMVDGFTIRGGGGYYDPATNRSQGGGLYVESSEVSLKNLVITGNRVEGRCDAVYDYATSSCDVDKQLAPEGAALYADDSSICMVNCLIVGNTVEYAAYEDWDCRGTCGGGPDWPTTGGIIYALMRGGDFSARHSTVADNRCDAWDVYDYECESAMMSSGSGRYWSGRNILWGFTGTAIVGSDYFDYNPELGHSIIGSGNLEGPGNLSEDPLFTRGPLGDYYLSQVSAGQSVDSPGIDAGGAPAAWTGIDDRTTRTDELADTGDADIGYHYPIPLAPVLLLTKGSTRLHYAPEDGEVYDLIRGRLSELRDQGTYIDLGAVECVADDDTSGLVLDELSPSEPPAGDVFWYQLGNQADGLKYGQSGGKELVPGSGDCP